MSRGSDMRSRIGGHHGEARDEYDRELLDQLIQQVRPTASEMRLIRKAVARYGKKNPTFGEVMGLRRTGRNQNEWWDEINPARPGIWSIANLIAMGFDSDHLTEAA